MGRPTGAVFDVAAKQQPCPMRAERRGVGMFGPALALFAALQNGTKIDHVRVLSPFFMLLTLAKMHAIARTSQLAWPGGNLV
jgi:hypothetical protein